MVKTPSGEVFMAETTTFFGESGHLNDEGVALFVDALKLDTVNQIPEQIRRHVEDCTECKTSITGVFSLLEKEDYGDVQNHPTFKLRKRPFMLEGQPILRIAAIVAGVCLVAALAYYLVVWKGGVAEYQMHLPIARAIPDSTAAPQNGLKKPTHARAGDFAANFTPNPEFEGMVQGGTRSEELTGMTPANGVDVRPPEVQFNWHSNSDEALTLIVYDNHGQAVFSAADTKPPVRMPIALEPGLYYWKLMNEEEGLHFGKFYVRR
jgi:hypothetical protein